MSERLCVVMPVYNEQEAIGPVLEKWARALDDLKIDYTIRPYNDGSKDNSLAVMREVAKNLPRVEVKDKTNGGHGNTILTGYREAAADGFDWVFQIDSDDEMGPEKFGELWEKRGDYDFLVGIRDGRVQALPRKIISFVSRCCVKLFYGRKTIWDVNTPYRLMRTSAFKDVYAAIPLTTFAPNVIISGMVARKGLKFFETRVPQHDRTTGEVSIKKWKLLKAAAKSFLQTIVFSCRTMSNEIESQKMHYRWVLAFLLFGVLLRYFVMLLGHNYDFESYCIVGEIVNKGGNVYAETSRYNYGPVFSWLQGSMWSLSRLLGAGDLGYRSLIVALLTVADGIICAYIGKRHSWKLGVLFFINPISVIITGYHNQFDNIAIAIMLLAVLLYSEDEKISIKDVGFCVVLGLSLITKHIFCLIPIWIFMRQQLSLKKRFLYLCLPIMIFLCSFVPYAIGNDLAARGIIRNVFLYGSFNNFPLLRDLLVLLHIPAKLWRVVFFGLMFIIGYRIKGESFAKTVVLYMLSIVAVSSAIANQYLVIAAAGLYMVTSSFGLVIRRIFIAWYTIFLCLEGCGLGLLNNHPTYFAWLCRIFVNRYQYSFGAWLLALLIVAELFVIHSYEDGNAKMLRA